MALRSALINVMTAAAKKASRKLLRDFGEVEQLQVSKKGPADFVTAADIRSESILLAELSRARPDYGILSEESGETKSDRSNRRWLVDPLDGTINFLHGIPHFCISIGLEEDGQIVAGTIYDPVRDEMFWAEKGAGAFLNDHRLRVSARGDLKDAVIATGIPHLGRDGHESFLAQLQILMGEVAGIRRLGSAALDLAYVAAGRYEGYWESNLAPWDLAAGMIIVREAGGYVADLTGRDRMLETGDIIAANDHLHRQIAALVGTQRPKIAQR